MAKLTATQTFQNQLEGTDYRIERAGMWFRLWQGEVMVKCCRSANEMADFISNMGLAPVGETLRQRIAQAAEANRVAEKRRLSDLLYTDEQFRRNGYGVYDSCPLPTVENEVVDESDYHSQHLEAGYCFQTMPSGVVYVYDPDGNPHIATDIDNADQCIRDGVWICGQQIPVEVHMSPIDDCGNQEVVISPAFEVAMTQALYDYNGVTIPALEADEDGVVFMPAYLTEQEYSDSESLMEF